MVKVLASAAGRKRRSASNGSPRKRSAKAAPGDLSAQVIRLPDALRIGAIRDLHAMLREAIDAQGCVTLDAAAVQTADTAALQLLYAFVRDGRDRGVQIVWEAPTENLRRDAERLGLGARLGLTLA